MSIYTTNQEVFDKVWEAFVVGDRQRAVREKGTPEEVCVYRGDRDAHSNTRCAIGVCIPDDMYDPELEEHGSIGMIHDNLSKWYNDVFNGIQVTFLSALQQIHDHSFGTFEKEMRKTASAYHLYIPSLPDEMPIPGVGINDLK